MIGVPPVSKQRATARAAVVVLSACAALTACTAWTPKPTSSLLETHDPRERLQLWVQGRPHLLHGIRATRDSITGVPYFQPPECESCRVHFALSAVDSVRVQHVDRVMGRNVMLVTLLAISVFVVIGVTAVSGAPVSP